MPGQQVRPAVTFALALVAGCGGGSPGPAVDAAVGDGAARLDAPAATVDAKPPTACVVTAVTTGSACHDDCDVRLTLPSNGRYCSLICSTDSECKPYGATLVCPADVGACLPSCSADAECQARGLPRCHPVGRFCDTLPACSSDAFCQANGLTRCVMPGAYCE